MGSSENKYSVKRYLIILSIATIVFLVGIGLFSYIVDPFFQYRVRSDSKYFLNPRFVNGGLAKHYNYNMAIIGSSMVQNYNLSILRKNDPEVRPVKLSTGGMNINEMEFLYSFLKKDSIKQLILNLDVISFNVSPTEGVRYPLYLYNDGFFNKLKYLYSYETVIRYAPIDIGLTLYLSDEKNMTLKYKMKTSIDEIGNTSLETNYSKEFVKDLYSRGITVSYQDQAGMEGRMWQRLDSMLSHLNIDKYKDCEYIFILPPYSALYWYHTQKLGYYDKLMKFVYYLNEKLSKYENVTILYFFDIDEIMNLDYYSDITHFSPVLSDKILENINNPQYGLNPLNIDSKRQRLDSLVTVFKEKNTDWIN